MIVIAAAVFGALLGVMSARRHKGNKKDMAQYAAGFGIAFALLGFLATIVIGRMAG